MAARLICSVGLVGTFTFSSLDREVNDKKLNSDTRPQQTVNDTDVIIESWPCQFEDIRNLYNGVSLWFVS